MRGDAAIWRMFPPQPSCRVEMAGEVLLPGPAAAITPTTFDQWLAAQEPSSTAC